MEFSDIHIHALFGCDDGAKSADEMFSVLDISYADGVREMCLTPHYHPGYYGDNAGRAEKAFSLLCSEAKERYPELKLYLGNELHYNKGCVSWLRDGMCRTLGGTSYVLVDFRDDAENKEIHRGLDQLLNAGYLPVLAHVERYRNLRKDLQDIRDFRENGVIIQVDAKSVLNGFTWGVRRRCAAVLKARLADIVASDAHDTAKRLPDISRCYQEISKQYGAEYAKALCRENPHRLLSKE